MSEIEYKSCALCGKEFLSRNPQHKYCCARCQSTENRIRYYRNNGNIQTFPKELSSSIGAACELIVCADLLSKGYHVFRSMSPTAPYDLVVTMKEKTIRVEVKKHPIGKVGSFVKHTLVRKPETDIVALMDSRDNSVTYFDRSGNVVSMSLEASISSILR